MPVIEGADLSSVSLSRAWPEAAYKTTIKESHFDEKGKNLVIVHLLREEVSAGGQTIKAGREYQDWINLVTNAGDRNELGWASIKKYFKALNPAHANDNPPNTDLLNGLDCTIYLTVQVDEDDPDNNRNRMKRIVAG